MTQHTINRLARLRIKLVRNLGHLAVRKLAAPTVRRASRRAARSSTGCSVFRIWILLAEILADRARQFSRFDRVIIVLVAGGYFVIEGRTQVGTLVVFISGLQRISDPWDQLINFYRTISNTASCTK